MSGKSARDVFSLDGKWRYMQDPEEQGEKKAFFDAGSSRDGWKEMAIPTNWYFTEVGDYTGVIWFAREFDLPSAFEDRSVVLRFNGVDYIADVWLNGTYLGNHEGFFNPFEFRVGKLLKPKGNSLVVRVDSPRDDTEYVLLNDATNAQSPMSDPYKRNWPADLKIVKGTFIDSEHRPGAYTAFGQDGNTGGIWESVELIASGSLTIDFVKTYTKIVEKLFVPDGTALVSVDFEIYNNTEDTVKAEVAIDITGKNFKSVEELKKNKIFTLKPGENIVKLVQTVSKPQLWWSWDLGNPNLYQMKVTVAEGGKVSDEVDVTFGIREMKVKDGHWFLNGKRIFARGMRYLSSNWMSEMDEKRFREDLDKIKDVNINAIRIGSHVEQPIFYDICDEMGLMVWQVFPLHYSYSDSDDLIERAAPMMRDMVRMFINNASVVMYSTFKEPKVYPIAAINKDREAPNNYGRLCEILYEAGHTVDPTKWIHLGDYEEGVQNIMPGFCQPGRSDVKSITLKPQIVEFGCGAVPCRETMEQIFKPEDLWPPNWDQWAYHNMRYTMFDWQELELKDSLDQVIEDSQDFAARQIKESAEFFRQRKHSPIGSIFLYFWNDPWPCIGSGLLDYYRRPYKSYHIYGMVYSPVLVSIEWIKDQHYLGFEKIYDPGDTFTAKIWVTNDLHQEYPDAQLTWALKDPDGKVVENGTKTILIPRDDSHVESRILWPIPNDAAKGEYRVEALVADKDGKTLSENYFVLKVK